MTDLNETNFSVKPERNIRINYIIYAMICIGYLFALVPRFGLAIYTDEISMSFNITASGLGVLASIYFYPYALMQIPCGFLSDKFLPEKLICISLILVSLGNIVFATTSNFYLALISRALTGFGGSLIYVPAMRYAVSYFPANKFGMLTGLLISINGLAVILVNGPLALVSEIYGWRISFLISATVTLLFGVVLKFLIKNNSTLVLDNTSSFSDGLKELGESSKTIIKNKYSRPMFIRSFLTYGVLITFQSLLAGPYMITFLGMSRIDAGKILVLMSVGTLIGSPIGGYLSDSIFKNRRKMSLIFIILSGICWIPLATMGNRMTPLMLTVILVVMGLLSGLSSSPQTAQVKEVFPKSVVGAGLGFNNLFMTGSGAIFPMLAGFMMGMGNVNPTVQFRNFFFISFIIMIIASIATYISVETYKKEPYK